MKSTIHVDHLARGKRQQVGGDGRDGLADVLGQAPAADRASALVEDQAVVFVLDHGGQVGGDDAGADFVDIDAELGQAVGP